MSEIPELKTERVVMPDGTEAEFVISSGNVFADLGLPNAAEHKFKSGLMMEITDIIEARGLTQTAAAQIVGVSQPKLSKMMRGQFRSISIDLLFRMLNRLGRDVQVHIAEADHDEAGRLLIA